MLVIQQYSYTTISQLDMFIVQSQLSIQQTATNYPILFSNPVNNF